MTIDPQRIVDPLSEEREMDTRADKILEGAIDMHCHGYPEVAFDVKMRMEDLAWLKLAADAKMKAVVLKSHMWPTVGRVFYLKQLITDIEIIPSITLNLSTGGLNPWAVESAARQGAKVVWMPTWTAMNDLKRNGMSRFMRGYLKTLDKMKPEEGITVLDSSGHLVTPVKEILHLAKEKDLVVSTGHLSPEESLSLARFCKEIGFTKLIFGHPDSSSVGGTLDHVKEMAAMGSYIEFAFLGMLPAFQRIKPAQLIEMIMAAGPDHCILSSDYYFEWVPPPSEMMRMYIATLLDFEVSETDLKKMVCHNPALLFNM